MGLGSGGRDAHNWRRKTEGAHAQIDAEALVIRRWVWKQKLIEAIQGLERAKDPVLDVRKRLCQIRHLP